MGIENLEVLVRRCRAAVQGEDLHRRIVADPLRPDVELALRRVDRDAPDPAAADVRTARVVEVARRGSRGAPRGERAHQQDSHRAAQNGATKLPARVIAPPFAIEVVTSNVPSATQLSTRVSVTCPVGSFKNSPMPLVKNKPNAGPTAPFWPI